VDILYESSTLEIQACEELENQLDIQSFRVFLGLAGYILKFVPLSYYYSDCLRKRIKDVTQAFSNNPFKKRLERKPRGTFEFENLISKPYRRDHNPFEKRLDRKT